MTSALNESVNTVYSPVNFNRVHKGGTPGRTYAFLPGPRLWVLASEDAAPSVAKGGNLFAKHVLSMDEEIRAGEELLVVDAGDRLLATGTAVLAPEEMLQTKRSIAVAARKAAKN